MIPSDSKIRFEELSAGRAMGDLSREEEREQFEIDPSVTFDQVVAALEYHSSTDHSETLPVNLAMRLHRFADEIVDGHDQKVSSVDVSAWQKIFRNPLIGWSAAAAIALIGVFSVNKSSPISTAQAEKQLRNEARDLIEWKFEGLKEFKDAHGKVVWSDQLQKGYMILNGIPINDSNKSQYQLWIVDPKRDEAPVDGGVFDIINDGSTIIVPIVAKLSLTDPKAFVITLEQPGGVVKSKQEQLVALAKN